MLRRGQQRIVGGQVAALEPAHPRSGKGGAQQHVFAGTFGATAPTLVAGDVHGRCVSPVQAGGGGLDRGGARGALGQLGLEAGGLAQRNREHRAHAVDHVGGQNHRDAQAAFFHGDFLDLHAQCGANAIEQRADPTQAHLLQHLVGIEHVGFGIHVRRERPHHVGEHTQLSDLLFDGHPGNQGFDAISSHEILEKTFTWPSILA